MHHHLRATASSAAAAVSRRSSSGSSHARHTRGLWLCSGRDAAGTSSSSTALSEHVTRTVLGCSTALMHLGVAPAGVGAFCTAAFSGAAAAATPDTAASLATSLRVSMGPVSGLNAELLSDALLGLGAQSVVVEEAPRDEGQPEDERFGADAELWDSCRLLAHFAVEVSLEGCFQGAAAECQGRAG
jgi:hypothetical protein